MTVTVARLLVFAATLLRAGADACDAFVTSLATQQIRCPDRVPDWIDDGSAP